jgi:DNA-directed RNA polymerase subunit M
MYQPRLNNFELPVDEYACPDGQGLPVVAYDNYTDNTCVIHSKTRGNAGKDEDADINSEQKETIEEQIKYQEYQENMQNQQPWGSDSDIRIIEPEKLPEGDSIVDTEVCPKCGNNKARWWMVQTDSADEPSTQFFRCTKCNNTWRISK